MSWTYSGDPSTSTRDHVRFLVGDTDPTDRLFENEELDALITEHTDPYIAGSRAAFGLAGKYARKTTVKTGDVTKNLSDLAKQFRELGASLERQAADEATPYFGGVSKAEKAEDQADSDLKQPHFGVGMHRNPQTDEPDELC